MKNFVKKYGKAIAAAIAAGLMVLASAVTDNHVDAGEGISIAIAVTTAVSVWLVPQLPSSAGAKTGVAMVLAVLQVAAATIVDGMSSADWVNLAIAALGVLGVLKSPAQSVGDDLVPRSAAAMSRGGYGKY
ncbi:hypothetical protein ACQEVZ_20335 [Dactylosporangium sp. CA-152071]|uniref:hypothetical protein n=1 Tax=Dactylosporangium sp. CA-152071 TaxID=3239933 RepID=UPI003D8B4E6D